MNNLDFSDVKFETISLHHVDSKSADQKFWTSKHPLHLIDNDRIQMLKNYLLGSFISPRWYTFCNESNSGAVCQELSKQILHNHDAFHHISKDFTEHLYECTEHPFIGDGEVYFVQMSGVRVGFETYEAFGVFKSESKAKFLQAVAGEEDYELTDAEGFSGIEYGSIIINYAPIDNYYLVSAYHPKQHQEVYEYYWKTQFLGLKEVDTNYVETEKFIQFLSAYFKDHLSQSVSTIQMINYLNKTSKFFKDSEQFEREEFTYIVIKDPRVLFDFNDYWLEYQTENVFTLKSSFRISQQAYKDNKKHLKHKISLDKNFVIEINGNIDYIESGVDYKKGLKYYKMYYKGEV